MSYRVFYGDGRELSDEDAPLTGDNARDVQVVLQPDEEVGPYFQTGGDYYVMWTDRWVAVDPGGYFDFCIEQGWTDYDTKITPAVSFELIRKGLISGRVLMGRTISNSDYKAIYQRARVVKTLWAKDERRP